MLFTLVGIEIDLRADPEKVYALIEVILLGILAFVSEVHSKNAYSKTEVTPEGIVMLTRPEDLNAAVPISVSVTGRIIEVSFLHP